ncbi:MAG TPA: sialate O-acetylesterase [Verrucomicrobiae bacterium]|jgi:sialate O-acetylesterase
MHNSFLRPAWWLVWVVSFCAGLSAHADLRLPAIFGDNMVLQQEQRVPVWGWCNPGAEVAVMFNGQTKTTLADANGRWLVRLGKMKASARPQTLSIVCHLNSSLPNAAEVMVLQPFTKVFTNVLIGEVWLCSGQSNMEKPLGQQPGQKPVFDYEAELAAADFPQIRLFKVGRVLSADPLSDLKKFNDWRECDSNALEGIKFSAAAYFFGREIHTNLNVPVGLIESSWGGTRIEPWTPPVGFEAIPSLTNLATVKIPAGQTVSNTAPMVIYNAMIAPIAGFGIRGALWYQGEANLAARGTNDFTYMDYAEKMAALVGGWRAIWDEGEFPFYFVQIAPYKYYGGKIPRAPSATALPEFWTIQSRAARCLKSSGMVVTTDLVNDLNDIHPRDKQTVGHRLALLARNKTYGQNLVSTGPTFRKMKRKGDKVILIFNHDEGGLISRNNQPLTWFTIAGADGKFVPAKAEIVNGTVEVSAAGITEPVAVRFAWDETAQPNLYNGAGLPAEPFRTDDR